MFLCFKEKPRINTYENNKGLAIVMSEYTVTLLTSSLGLIFPQETAS
jgi:hypothetical protein